MWWHWEVGGTGRWLVCDGRALMNGISALIKEVLGPFLTARSVNRVVSPHQKPRLPAPLSVRKKKSPVPQRSPVNVFIVEAQRAKMESQ